MGHTGVGRGEFVWEKLWAHSILDASIGPIGLPRSGVTHNGMESSDVANGFCVAIVVFYPFWEPVSISVVSSCIRICYIEMVFRLNSIRNPVSIRIFGWIGWGNIAVGTGWYKAVV